MNQPPENPKSIKSEDISAWFAEWSSWAFHNIQEWNRPTMEGISIGLRDLDSLKLTAVRILQAMIHYKREFHSFPYLRTLNLWKE